VRKSRALHNKHPVVLIVTTQTWLQVTRLALRFAAQGCHVFALCPGESHLTSAPQIEGLYTHSLLNPVGALRHALLSSHADYILPTDDLSVWLLHELVLHMPSFAPLVERSLGSSSSFPVLRSRFRLLQLAHQLGIAVPRTEVIANTAALEPWCTTDASAFVLKKDGTWGGGGVQIVRGPDHALNAYRELLQSASFSSRAAVWLRNGDASAFARLQCTSKPQITAQALVPGIPANSMYACHEGRILGEVQAKVIASKGSIGPSFAIELIADPRISHAGHALAAALGISGFFGLDFILDARTGEPFLLELNPRSTQLGHLAVPGQVSLSGLLWAQWTTQQTPAPASPTLSKSIGFYPDAQQLVPADSAISTFRSDLVDNEEEVLSGLLFRHASRKVAMRRHFWRLLARFKTSLSTDATPRPYYHGNPQPNAALPQTRIHAIHSNRLG
jgi:hypothetical protein